MAASSTNKMPLLIDRPLHSFASIGGTAALSTASNYNTVTGNGCVLLVDCTSNDGAVVDSISVVANEASTQITGSAAVEVLVFLSLATTTATITTTNTLCVAAATISTAIGLGSRTNIALPALSVPVPNLGGDSSLTETDKKNTGLYIPSGATLYVGTQATIASPSANTRLNVFAQGGFF